MELTSQRILGLTTVVTAIIIVMAVAWSGIFLVGVFNNVSKPDPKVVASENVSVDTADYQLILDHKLRPRQ